MPTILVVDDARFSRKAVMTSLASVDCEFVQAANGQEGLEQIDAVDPDVVISDLLMPVMDGFEFLAAVRARGDQRPMFIVSADIQQSARTECETLGATHFLNKPFAPSELVARVNEALACAEGV